MEPEETAVARQRLCKHLASATNAHAKIELLNGVFYVVLAVSTTQYVLKRKLAVNSSQNLLFYLFHSLLISYTMSVV
jgi:hypothetical protein